MNDPLQNLRPLPECAIERWRDIFGEEPPTPEQKLQFHLADFEAYLGKLRIVSEAMSAEVDFVSKLQEQKRDERGE